MFSMTAKIKYNVRVFVLNIIGKLLLEGPDGLASDRGRNVYPGDVY